MGKIQSKHGLTTVGIRKQRKREGPEGECFIVKTTQPSTEELSLCISQDDLRKVADADRYPLTVVLPPEKDSFSVKTSTTDADNKSNELLLLKLEKERISGSVTEKDEEHKVSSDIEDDYQEFNFTLYDVDGHGKFTEDGITSLVNSIQNTVGGIVEVPNSGSKLINVKLTVSPSCSESSDRKKSVNIKNNFKKFSEIRTNKVSDVKDKPKATRMSTFDPVYVSSQKSHHFNDQINEKLRDETHIKQRLSHSLESSPIVGHKYRHVDKNMSLPCSNRQCSSPDRHRKKMFSGSLQRHELLELIHENMEKNNLNYNQFRKSYESKPNHDNYCQKSDYVKYRTRENLPECNDRRNHYLDLAGIEHCSPNEENLYDSIKPPSHSSNHRHSHHRRSHSHHNNYDSQYQYRQFQNCSKSNKLRYLDNSELVHDPPQRHNHSRSYSYGHADKVNPRIYGNVNSKKDLNCSSHQNNHHPRHRSPRLDLGGDLLHLESNEHKQNSRKTKTSHHEHHYIHEHVHHHYHHYVDL